MNMSILPKLIYRYKMIQKKHYLARKILKRIVIVHAKP